MTKPLTRVDLAEALSCFWNAALGAQHRGTTDVGCMAEGIQAVSVRLKELDEAAAGSDAAHLVEIGQIWRHNLTSTDWRITAAEPDNPTCNIASLRDGSSTDLPCDILRRLYTLQPAPEPKAPRYVAKRAGMEIFKDGVPLISVKAAAPTDCAPISQEELWRLMRRLVVLLTQYGEG